jgi:hypothetical protein
MRRPDRRVYRCSCGAWAYRSRPCVPCALIALDRSAS